MYALIESAWTFMTVIYLLHKCTLVLMQECKHLKIIQNLLISLVHVSFDQVMPLAPYGVLLRYTLYTY